MLKNRLKPLNSLEDLISWPSLFVIYSFLFPFSLAIGNVFLGIFILRWMQDAVKGKIVFNRKVVVTLSVYTAFYFTMVLSSFYSLDVESARSLLYRNFPLVIFPIIIFSVPIKDKKKIIFKSTLAFSTAVLIINTLSFLIASAKWIRNPKESQFLQGVSLDNFSKALVNYDYLYLALYTSFALLVFLNLSFSKNRIRRQSFFCFLIVSILFLCLIFIGGRNSIVTTVLLGGGMLLYKSIMQKRYVFILGAFTFFVLTFFINYQYNSYFKERVGEMINYNNQYNINKHWGGRGVRKEIWKCAISIIEKQPIFGVGIGDSQFILNHCYYGNNISALIHFKKKYNVHNQYLQYLLEIGLVGLMLFLTYLLYPFFLSIKKGNYEHIVFLLITIVFMITESIFHRNFGILFFGFFHSFLFSYHNEKC